MRRTAKKNRGWAGRLHGRSRSCAWTPECCPSPWLLDTTLVLVSMNRSQREEGRPQPQDSSAQSCEHSYIIVIINVSIILILTTCPWTSASGWPNINSTWKLRTPRSRDSAPKNTGTRNAESLSQKTLQVARNPKPGPPLSPSDLALNSY